MKTSPFIERFLRQKSEAGSNESHNFKLAARPLVALLLEEEPLTIAPIQEASVHLGRRSRVFVATFTAAGGGQTWRTTGLTDYDQALMLARQWEAEARAQRASLGPTPRKPGTRVRPGQAGTRVPPLTQKEVARILNMSERGVREVERRAFQKLRQHPLLRQLWDQYFAGELDEDCGGLDPAEAAALFDVAGTRGELRLIEKILAMLRS